MSPNMGILKPREFPAITLPIDSWLIIPSLGPVFRATDNLIQWPINILDVFERI
jgi:hypothetical protein